MRRKFPQFSFGLSSLVVLLLAAHDTRPCGSGSSSIAPLPTLGGTDTQVNGLNAAGQITGFSFLTGNSAAHAFRFSAGSTIDLGTLGGDISQGLAINALGQVAGDADTATFEIHAFLHDGTEMIDLGTLGGFFSSATALNDLGQAVGFSDTFDSEQHAFIYSDETMTDLGHLGGGASTAAAINNSGTVIGDSLTEFFDEHAFYWTNGLMVDLGTLGGFFSSAFALNDAGVIVGESTTGAGETHGFIYDGGVMTDVGTLGGAFSSAHAINNFGQVIGLSTTSAGDVHGFIYSSGVLTDLGTLGGSSSAALGLNNFGQVVGDSTTSSGATHAFVWQNGTMVDLNSLLPAGSGWVLSRAGFINDSNRVVGQGTLNGVSHVFVMDLGAGGNNPPVAVAGADQVVACQSMVTLDGTQSSDPDNDLLAFEWKEGDTLLGTTPILTLSLPVGTHTITLTVTDPCEASATDTLVVSVVDTNSPVIVGGPALGNLPANGQCQGAVPDVTGAIVATDNCTPTNLLTIVQAPAAGSLVGLGSHTILVTVTDLSSNSTAGTLSFSVVDVTAPVIVAAPSSITLSANSQCQAAVPNVVPDVTVTDNCSAANDVIVSQNPLAGTLLGTGTHAITVTATDAAGNSTSHQVQLIIQDTTAPVVSSISVTPNVLSPPNKAIVPVTVSIAATDNCDPAPVSQIISITSSEPADPGDILITGALTANLAATRNPSGGGRVYLITVEVSDTAGNSTLATVTVTVPKGLGGGGGGRP